MKKRIIYLGVILFSLVSCVNGSNDNQEKEVVTDLIGREVTLEKENYERVVCIGAGALRLYSYIGDIKLVKGVEDIENYSLTDRPTMFDTSARPYFIKYKEYFKTLPSVGKGGPQAQSPELEKILSVNPDIIISEYEDIDTANYISESIGVPVITLDYGSKGVFDDNLKASLTLLGKIFHKEERAETLVNYINSEENKLTELTINLDTTKKAYICGLGNWGTTDYLTTSSNYEPFNVANINNIAKDLGINGTSKIEKEKFEDIANDIDIMIIDAAAIKNIKTLFKEDNTIFNNVKAFKENNVYLEMAYNVYYTNCEIALINAWFNASIYHKDSFKEFDIDAKCSEVTKVFLGEDLKDSIYNYETSYGGYGKIDISIFIN